MRIYQSFFWGIIISMVKKIKISISLIIVAIITTVLIKMYTLPTDISLIATFKIPELPQISELKPGDFREKAISLDGKIIQETSKNQHPTASTAKMILGLAIIDKKPFSDDKKGELITITQEFYDKYLWYYTHNGSTTAVTPGEEISQYDALASVFLASSNNMADTLAIWAFGSLEGYQEYATKMLKNMGLENTHLGKDASGYSETTTSTAGDLAIIATKLLENPILKEIVSLKSHTVPIAGELKNTNKILGDVLNNGSVVSGVKTGYIGDVSGYNLISAYEKDGHTITLALLGASTRSASFEESKAELLRLSEEIIPTKIVESGQPVGYFETWWSGRHEIEAKEDISIIAVDGDSINSMLNQDELKISIDDGKEYSIRIQYNDFAKSPTFWERFLHIFGWQR